MDDPIAVVERFRDAFSAGTPDRRLDLETGAETFTEVIRPYAADDFVCIMDGGALTTSYEGIEGMRRGWDDFQRAFETIAIEPDEMRMGADGESVVEFVRLRGKAVGAVAEIDHPAAAVWRFRDGMLKAVEFHIDRASALRAGGLDPAAPGPPHTEAPRASGASNAERLIEALAPAFPGVETEVDEALIEQMIEALAPLTADEIDGLMSGAEGWEASFEGVEGLRERWLDWMQAFARIRFEMEAIESVGENVLTLARQVGTTRHGGVEITQPSAAVWKFRDGRLVRIEFHLDRERANESARRPA